MPKKKNQEAKKKGFGATIDSGLARIGRPSREAKAQA